jgi:hypothetical protein
LAFSTNCGCGTAHHDFRHCHETSLRTTISGTAMKTADCHRFHCHHDPGCFIIIIIFSILVAIEFCFYLVLFDVLLFLVVYANGTHDLGLPSDA